MHACMHVVYLSIFKGWVLNLVYINAIALLLICFLVVPIVVYCALIWPLWMYEET